MEIKEAVEQIRKIARVENGEISIGKGLDREMNELTHYIIVAILNGYTLCKVDEAVEKMDDLIEIIYADDSGTYKHGHTNGVSECIDIIKEACK